MKAHATMMEIIAKISNQVAIYRNKCECRTRCGTSPKLRSRTNLTNAKWNKIGETKCEEKTALNRNIKECI
jgi:hypothetical protein